jgi:hypothetical protein
VRIGAVFAHRSGKGRTLLIAAGAAPGRWDSLTDEILA